MVWRVTRRLSPAENEYNLTSNIIDIGVIIRKFLVHSLENIVHSTPYIRFRQLLQYITYRSPLPKSDGDVVYAAELRKNGVLNGSMTLIYSES